MTDEKQVFVITVRRSLLYVIAATIVFVALSTITYSVLFGIWKQQAKDEQIVKEAQDKLKDQELKYEKRLGEQSARYAQEAAAFAAGMAGINTALDEMKLQNRKYAFERERALSQINAAAKVAADEAKASKERIAELTRKTEETKQVVVTAASEVKESQQKLEHATLPSAQVPPVRWGGK